MLMFNFMDLVTPYFVDIFCGLAGLIYNLLDNFSINFFQLNYVNVEIEQKSDVC